MASALQFSAVFEEEEEGGYTVTVPALPGCVSYGRTIEAAKHNIQKAVRLHLACLKAHSKSKTHAPALKNIFTAILHLKAA
ncbi:MAG: type II toxin-antitoxin system HicB family antitoxin [Deltaproteobacteria bacterium]|nr:type II toxin-antitoxin system HicB family antitoxin [Deltaproteobacteria bacterium]